MSRQYKVVFEKGSLAPGVVKRDFEDAKRYPEEKWRQEVAERAARVDGFYGFDSPCMGCHGGSGGPMNHEEIPQLVRDHVKQWLSKTWHWSEPRDDDDGKRRKPTRVNHRPINRSNVYFRTAFPEVLDREGFFKLVEEVKKGPVVVRKTDWESGNSALLRFIPQAEEARGRHSG